MFYRRRQQQQKQDPASSAVNKLLTYGLLAFLVFAMYSEKKPKPVISQDPINYTPVELGNYVHITNLLTGENNYHPLEELNKFKLTVNKDQLKNTKGEVDLYEIEINTSKTANIFNHID